MTEKPKISILIPARNEAENLPRLFSSLDNLDYQRAQLEVLLGNDCSEDSTGTLMDDFAKTRPWVTIIHLNSDPNATLKGKTRVLDILSKKSTGRYLFFTDADIELPPSWITGMLRCFEENTGVVVGVTGFKRTGFLSTLMGIEWLMALAIFKLASLLGLKSTGLGNNMAVSREAYDKVGGYEKIGFSIVEDYHLYNEIIKAGYAYFHAFNSQVLAYTLAPQNYFEQRRRWIKGALENSPEAMGGGILQAFCIPLLILIGYFNSTAVWIILASLLLIYTGFILFFQYKLKLKGYLLYLIPFTAYISVAWLAQFLYFIFSKKTVWKGREYS